MLENSNNIKQSKSEYILIASALFIVALILIYIAVYSPPLVPENIASNKTVTIETATQISTTENVSFSANSELININTATVEQFISLNGIGETIAKRIVDYRTENGNFKNIEELLNVSGIGEKKFNEIKKYLSINW